MRVIGVYDEYQSNNINEIISHSDDYIRSFDCMA